MVTYVILSRKWYFYSHFYELDVPSIEHSIVNHVEYTLASTRFNFDSYRAYLATSHSVRDRLIENLNDTTAYFEEQDVKRTSYLSLEFLMGRSLQNSLINLDCEENFRDALFDLGFKIEDLYECENDAALGNGGLGRLAACFLDSMATLNLPAWGYGIRYTYGIFKQLIINGEQVENPDYWLTFGNPWEIQRLDVKYPIGFYGTVETYTQNGLEKKRWVPSVFVNAVACDNPIPGYRTNNTINLRLWKAKPSQAFDLGSFNRGDYFKALEESQRAETITSVLYPNDSTYSGKELRLKQQYFFVSATLQDLIKNFKKRMPRPWSEFAAKNSIQLNDTHPSIGIAELMRLLMDEEGLSYEEAWDITTKTFAYTNHTVLPEALEKWSVDLIGSLLPRHLQIIELINWNFMQFVDKKYNHNFEKMNNMSIFEEGFPKRVRMANLAIIGSFAVNGVAEIHSEIIKKSVFPDFYELWPEKFQNKTNGVTPRRWMLLANPEMSKLITETIGDDNWAKDLSLISALKMSVDDGDLMQKWYEVKLHNKIRLATYLEKNLGIKVNPNSMFDVLVKRIHEYKRQFMDILYCCYRYLWIKKMSPEERKNVVPRVSIFGGKAAPAYVTAKRIIKFINQVASVVNNDPDIGDLFKVVFIPNYNVSLAEMIIPAAELSQHISTAGTEASGTSNMKFAMNGSLIIGTRDGANIEIALNIGEENIFYFGALTDEVERLRSEMRAGQIKPCPELEEVFKEMESGRFCPVGDAYALLDTIKNGHDQFLVIYDFKDYLRAQRQVDETYKNKEEWTRMSIMSVASMGFFSTDRVMKEYSEQIWHIEPCSRPVELNAGMERVRSLPNFDPNKARESSNSEKFGLH